MDDELLGRRLTEWGLLTEKDLREARDLQARFRLAGGHKTLGQVLVEFGFLNQRQIEDALAVTEGLPAPNEDLPLDVVEAMQRAEAKFGHYLMLEEVGRGGLGIVHRAWDTETRTIVALKFLRSEASLDQERVVELIMEGSRLSRLRHPNIISVYEFGQIRGQFYIAMELLEGMGLDQLVKSARSRGQLSPFYSEPKRYLAILRDVARAVHFAHTRTPPIIHCDLKPHNVFVDLSWKPRLVDFGLARELRHETGAGATGDIKGSPSYMAPEQVLGRTDEIDIRTDVYGLGAILYELLSGRPPYAGDLQTVLDQNLLVDPPAPSAVVAARVAISSSAGPKPVVPPELEAICMKCLAKERRDRFQTAREVAEAIDPLVGDRPLRVRTVELPAPTAAAPAPARPSEAELATRRRKPVQRAVRRSALLGFVAGVAAVAAVVVGIAWMRAYGGPGESDRIRKITEDRLDELAGGLQIEAAEGGWREVSAGRADKSTADWTARKMEELRYIRMFRDKLVRILDRERDYLPAMRLRDGSAVDGTVLTCDVFSVTLFSDGSERRLAWKELEPLEILRLADFYSHEMDDNQRIGVGLFAMKNRMWTEAKAVLERVKSPIARAYERALPAPE